MIPFKVEKGRNHKVSSVTGSIHQTLNSFISELRLWRSDGHSVVLTRGVFDLLHFGHRSYLLEAAKHGRNLVVFIDSDKKVRARKGEGRPVQTIKERALSVAQLPCVDAVVYFGEELSNQSLVADIRPDVFVVSDERMKPNSNYSYARPHVRKIIAVPRTPNISTSQLCPSSNNLEHLSGFPFGGSGSSLIEFMRIQFGGASAA